MTDEKYPGGPPPENQPPPPAYTPGPQGGMPPPTGGYPPAYPPQPGAGYSQATTVVVGAPVGAQPGSMFRYNQSPAHIICQHCNATVTTSITYEAGLLTWIAMGVICLFGCWLGCCLIPLCVDACKDTVHTCPNCRQLVGKYRQIS